MIGINYSWAIEVSLVLYDTVSYAKESSLVYRGHVHVFPDIFLAFKIEANYIHVIAWLTIRLSANM